MNYLDSILDMENNRNVYVNAFIPDKKESDKIHVNISEDTVLELLNMFNDDLKKAIESEQAIKNKQVMSLLEDLPEEKLKDVDIKYRVFDIHNARKNYIMNKGTRSQYSIKTNKEKEDIMGVYHTVIRISYEDITYIAMQAQFDVKSFILRFFVKWNKDDGFNKIGMSINWVRTHDRIVNINSNNIDEYNMLDTLMHWSLKNYRTSKDIEVNARGIG